jgi:HTH-type transcriptional repressor of NAD biosynthesis genes
MALPQLQDLADRAAVRYHVTFVCGDDIPYHETWDRSGAANRAVMQAWTLAELSARGIPFVVVRGSLQERLDTVRSELAKVDLR